jgi:ribosomal protein S18 acetylase RimI-like enzyme
MQIRRATPDDAEALASLHVAAWRAAYRGLVPEAVLARLDPAHRAQRFRDSLATGSEETYLAEEDGVTLGFLTLGACRDADVHPDETGEIWGIYLAPQHWRRGVGRALRRYGEGLLQARGYTLATLWVFRDNKPARRFYEAMGFTADGASKTLHLDADLEAVRCRKELARSGLDKAHFRE